MIKYMIGNYQ